MEVNGRRGRGVVCKAAEKILTESDVFDIITDGFFLAVFFITGSVVSLLFIC